MKKSSHILNILKHNHCKILCFIDVGAKDELEFIEAMSAITNMIAFEPNPIEMEILRAKYQNNNLKDLKLEMQCLLDSNGQTRLNITKHASMSSILDLDLENYQKHFGAYQQFEKWKDHIGITTSIMSTTVTLDTYFANVTGSIDYLKLDTQGTELQILKGAAQLIASNRINVIKVEVSTIPVYKNQALFSDIDSHLRCKGYVLVDFITYRENYTPIFTARNKSNHYAPCGDAIYVLGHEKMTEVSKIKSGLVLLWLGYHSLGSFYLRTTNISEQDLETLSHYSFSKVRFKQVLKNFCPPILLYWYKKLLGRL